MNKTFLIITGLVAAFGIFVWQLLKPPENIAVAAVESASTAQISTATALSPASPQVVTSSRPAATPPVQKVARAVVPLKSALAQEFEKAKELKLFYDRYAANPEGASAELKYFAASAIENCVGRGRAVGSGTVGGSSLTEAARAKFQSKLKDNDPANSQRIAAFERVNQICEGFQSLNLTGADAVKLFREAAAAGNPGARVALATEDYREQARTARGVEERRLSEDQLSSVRDGLATGDPFAIQRAGQLLSWGSSQLTDRGVGPNNEPFNVRDFGPAWTLAACDRGANCGADAYRVLNGCAQLGACGYDSLETYMQYNELPPNAYANAQQYRSMILDAIEQRRWDWLGIAQGSGRTVTVTPQAAVKPGAQTGRSG
jgi:hypothetical protein